MSDTIQPSQPEITQPEVQPTEGLIGGEDINLISLKGYLGLENLTETDKDTLKWVYGYFSQKGLSDMTDILLNIRAVERKLPATPLSGSRLNSLYQYLKIQSQIEQLTGVKQSMESNV